MKKLFKKFKQFITSKLKSYRKKSEAKFFSKHLYKILKEGYINQTEILSILTDLDKKSKAKKNYKNEDDIMNNFFKNDRQDRNKKLKICIKKAQQRGLELNENVKEVLKSYKTLDDYWNSVKLNNDLIKELFKEKK
jgi:predicted NodU family carbamoyl transferase